VPTPERARDLARQFAQENSMPQAAGCFDLTKYQELAAGQLADADEEILLRHLERCDDCARKLATLGEPDTLVGLIRQAQTLVDHAPEGTLGRLIGRLSKLRPDQASAGAGQTLLSHPQATGAGMTFMCTACGRRLKVKGELAGKKIKCPHCKGAMRVPASGGGASLAEARTLGAVQAIAPDVPTASYHPSGTPAKELYDFLAPAQAADELGRLGPYRVLAVLGAGGMGVVFRAEDPQLNRLVALKAMLPSMAGAESNRQRFLREARAAAAIKHDHIVSVYQVGEDRGVPFLAMEFLEGEPLDKRLQREGKLPLVEVLRFGREIALGLAAAHKRGLIHRDIKPGNLWVEAETGRIKVLDFGLARAAKEESPLTQSGAILGTPEYMAPEQIQGKDLDGRCDLFSLGCVLYRMATGRMPFAGTDMISTLMAVATEQPPPPRVINPALPQQFSALVMKLLAKNPADRMPSAQLLLEALAGIEQQTAVSTMGFHGTAAPASTATAAGQKPARSRVRKNRLLLGSAIGALAFLVLVGLIVVRIATDKGELVIETDDPNIEVVVTQGGKQVTIIDVQMKQQIRLASGTYELELAKGRQGLRLSTDTFTLTRGSRETVRVHREVASPTEPAGTLRRQLEVFMPLFNGKDLTGWRVVRGAPDDWQVEQGGIGFTGADTAHLSILASDKEYKDYAVRFEFQAEDKALAGFVVRSMPGHGALDAPAGSIAIAADKLAGRFYWSRLGDYVSCEPKPHLQARENWDQMEIRLHGTRLQVLVNGDLAQNLNLDQIPDRPVTRPYLRRAKGTIEFRKIVGTVHMRNIELCDLSNMPPPMDAVAPARIVIYPQGRRAVGIDGQWLRAGDELVQTDLASGRLFFGDIEWTNYDFSCEAMRVEGTNAFDIIVRAADKYNYYLLDLGGWNNTKRAWSSVNEGVGTEFKGWRNARATANQWYRVRVSVRGPHCQCYVDEQLIFDFTDHSHLGGAVGLNTFKTKARFRNIKVTAPDGKILWEGVPELEALEDDRRQ
jgi:predicted Ser/Thr protein kinase